MTQSILERKKMRLTQQEVLSQILEWYFQDKI